MDNISYYGIRPAQGRWSSDYAPVRKFVATAYQAAPGAVNVDLNIGDPVIRVSDGSVAIAVAGATNPIYGIIVGVDPVWDAALGAKRFSDKVPGGTVWGTNQDRRTTVQVLPVFGRYWELEVDDAVTATTELAYAALIGQNVNLIYQASATTGKANPKVDISLNNTTNTFQFNIVDVSTSLNNQDYSGANVKLIVVANLVDEAPLVLTGI